MLDIGCGGGHLVQDFPLAVGPSGKAYGIDPGVSQVQSAQERCTHLFNADIFCGGAEEMDPPSGSCHAISFIQTLEFIKETDPMLSEIRQLLKRESKFANVSVLWDHSKFHGPEENLNNTMHEAYKDHRYHQVAPPNLPTKLKNRI